MYVLLCFLFDKFLKLLLVVVLFLKVSKGWKVWIGGSNFVLMYSVCMSGFVLEVLLKVYGDYYLIGVGDDGERDLMLWF